MATSSILLPIGAAASRTRSVTTSCLVRACAYWGLPLKINFANF
jgi:hypothetical protein